MTTKEERAANWAALETEIEWAAPAAVVLVRGWKYPEGELIVRASALDHVAQLLVTKLDGVEFEIRVRLDETGRIPGSAR